MRTHEGLNSPSLHLNNIIVDSNFTGSVLVCTDDEEEEDEEEQGDGDTARRYVGI